MILKHLTFLSLFFFSLLSYSQYYKRSQLDYLKNEQQNYEGEQKVRGLLDLANAYVFFQLDSAQLFLDLARTEAHKQSYEWGICQSFWLEAEIDLRRGKKHVNEVKDIKTKCAKWFENNHFYKDALLVEMNKNEDVFFSEGMAAAFNNAELFLMSVKNFDDPILHARAWEQINRTQNFFFYENNYQNSADSSKYYFAKTTDSLKLINISINNIFRKHGGKIPKDELFNLEKIARDWNNPSLWVQIEKIKAYPFALRGNIDSTAYFINRMKGLELEMGARNIYRPHDQLLNVAYLKANNHLLRIDLLLKLLAQNRAFGIKLNIANNLYDIGQCCFLLNEYESSITYFLEAITTLEELDDKYRQNSVKRRLADLYVITNEYEKAEKYYREVIDWSTQVGENLVIQIMLGNAYHSLAKMYQKQEEYESAALNYAYSIDHLKKSSTRIIEPHIGLMSLYLDMGQIELADSINDKIINEMSSTISTNREFYLEKGRLLIAKMKYAEGIESLDIFLSLGNGNEIIEENKQTHFLRYETYKKIGQGDSALVAFESFKRIEDSLEIGTVKENVQKIQSDYEISLKESEIKNLQQQKEISDLEFLKQEDKLTLRQLYITLLVFAFLLFGGIAYLLFRRFQRKKEEEKKEITKQLEIEGIKYQQKVELAEVKNNLYANISHEFKTPLTLIRVPLENFRIKADEKDKTTYDSIIKNTDHLLEMLDELLGVSNMESGPVKLNASSFDLAHLLPQIKLNFAPLFSQKNIQFDWHVELEQNDFIGDENKIQVVINNLLKNAYSNTPENGWVNCEVYLKEQLTIKVSNNGSEISEEDLPYIFDRFYRSRKNEYSGSGIGLTWSKQIVELHDGTIHVENTKLNQVTFVLKIPKANKVEKIEDIQNHSIESQTLGKNTNLAKEEVEQQQQNLRSVLVVEDNIEMRELIDSILKTHFKLDFAENGEIGEEMAIRQQPDLVLSDVMMPKKDGFELLKSLKENFNTSHIPVILLTACSDSDSRITGLNQDADDYISKPFDAIGLIAKIDSLLRQRKHLHKLFSQNPLIYAKEIQFTPIDANFIEQVLNIMENNYTKGDFTLSQLCSELSLNRTSVNIKIKALTNQSTAAYIKNFRLEKAAKMLVETKANITEVYIDNGFNSPQSFNKAFKKKFGKSPSEYRITFFK